MALWGRGCVSRYSNQFSVNSSSVSKALSFFPEKRATKTFFFFQLEKKINTPSWVEVLAESMGTGGGQQEAMASWHGTGWGKQQRAREASQAKLRNPHYREGIPLSWS